MHGKFGSRTLLQLAFPGESNLNFPSEKSHWDNTVVKRKTTTTTKQKRILIDNVWYDREGTQSTGSDTSRNCSIFLIYVPWEAKIGS